MKYAPYSASRLGCFKQCPRKFKYQYIDKLPYEFKPSIALTKGNIVHSFLENHELDLPGKIAALKKEKQVMNSPFYTKELVKECLGIYNTYIQSKLGQDNFNNLTLGNEMQIALDKKLQPCGYLSEDVLFRGYIDRISVDQKTDIVTILDYKTGKLKNEGPYKQPFDQPLYYASWYFEKFPVDTIILQFDFVEHNHEPMQKVLTRENLIKYKKFLLTNIMTAEKCTDFVKNEGPLCDYCDFQEICMKDNDVHTIDISEDDIPF